MPSRRALITGGAGFIGSHLCEYLVENGWAVTAVDDLSTGARENLAELEGNADFSLEVGNAGDRDLVERLADEADAVFHLAAVVGVRKVMENTVETIEKNLHTTEVVLKAAARRKVPFLLTSTSEVYGSNRKEAFKEDDESVIGNSRHRRWCYAAGKLLDEFHAYAYHHSRELPVIITRLFNTIGPRQVGHYGMVVPTFVSQALRGETITVYGDGSQRRCFAYVKDTVKCLAALIDNQSAAGEVFNVGSDVEITIMQLAEKIKALTGSSSAIETRSYSEVFGEDFVDMERRLPDVSKLRKAIGFAPETRLEDVLQAVIDHERA
jgi:nucleoside-diphosphate-sugar epimerase